MADILNLPDIPSSLMFIGDERKVMTIEWQEFFRVLFNRVGGTTSTTIIETDTSVLAELYKTDKNYDKRIDDLEFKIESLPKSYVKKINEFDSSPSPKSYDKRIDDLELGFVTFNPFLGNAKIRRISQNAQPA